MNVFELITYLFSVLIYPGLTFLVVLGLLTQWYIRKLVGRMQNRIGPKYVGFMGIAQPFADIIKLMFVKKELSFRHGLRSFLVIFISLGMGALASAMLFTPISPYLIRAPYDVILFIYLMLWTTIALALIGLSLSNPFTIVGSSRFLTQVLFTEPAIVMSVLAAVIVLSKDSEIPFSIYSSLAKYSIGPMSTLVIALSLISYIIATIAKSMLKPFDIPEAETELAGGIFAELSGPALALTIVIHYTELAFLNLIAVLLFLGGPYPLSYGDPLGALIITTKYVILLTAITSIRASTGRIRIEQALTAILKYPLTLSTLSLIIAMLMHIKLIL